MTLFQVNESFNVEVGLRQGCIMSLWLFNIYMDACIRDMKVGVWDLGARLNVRSMEQPSAVVCMRMTHCCWLKVIGCCGCDCSENSTKAECAVPKIQVFKKRAAIVSNLR